MLEAKISDNELRMLMHMHQNVSGFGPSFRLPTAKIAETLGIELKEAVKCASYLVQHGLAGSNEKDEPFRTPEGKPLPMSMGGKKAYSTLWLTGIGENFCRTLEAEPSFSVQVTQGVIAKIGDEALNIARAILTELIKVWVRGS